MKWTVNTDKFDSRDTALVSLLQLLCSLEFAIASAKWYVGEEAKTTELPPHEQVLALAINIASIGEALNKFDEFKNKGIIQFSDTWEIEVKNSWEFLSCDEVAELKRSNLKYVRDKSAFHIDPEPVKQYIDLLDVKGEVNIWEFDEGNNVGHSPLAAFIIANTLLNRQMNNHTTAGNTSKVYGALRDVIRECLYDKLG